jgi:hypothetical protein
MKMTTRIRKTRVRKRNGGGGDAPLPPLRVPALSRSAKAWADGIAAEYGISDKGGVSLLYDVAARAYDRAQEAGAILARDGLVTYDRWNMARPHPCCAIERSARAAIITALRALRLDMEPSSPMGRPAGAAHWRPEEGD